MNRNLSNVYLNSIPSFFGILSKLRYLNLSSSLLSVEIPPQIGTFSNLQFLDLSNNCCLRTETLNWVLRLSSLQLLCLSHTDMSLANDWVHVINKLPPFLTHLQLSGCNLPNIVAPSFSRFNSSKFLKVIDISENSLSESLFQ